MNQSTRVVTTGHSNCAARACQNLKFSRWGHVAINQYQEFGRSVLLIAAKVDVSGQQGQHVIFGDLLTDASHSKTRSERTRDDYISLLGRCGVCVERLGVRRG